MDIQITTKIEGVERLLEVSVPLVAGREDGVVVLGHRRRTCT